MPPLHLSPIALARSFATSLRTALTCLPRLSRPESSSAPVAAATVRHGRRGELAAAACYCPSCQLRLRRAPSPRPSLARPSLAPRPCRNPRRRQRPFSPCWSNHHGCCCSRGRAASGHDWPTCAPPHVRVGTGAPCRPSLATGKPSCAGNWPAPWCPLLSIER